MARRPDQTLIIAHLQGLMLHGTRWASVGDDPRTGANCYGFIRHVFALTGIALPAAVEEAESFFEVVPLPFQPWDILLTSFETWRGERHLALLLHPPSGWHYSRATNGVARFSLQHRLWQRGSSMASATRSGADAGDLQNPHA